MSLRQKYLDVVSRLATPGAVGVAVLLGSAVPGAASQDLQPTARPGERVSERLAAIREAVSTVAGETSEPGGATKGQRLAWGNWRNGGGFGGFGFGLGNPWGNFGFGGGSPWNNWNNWHNGWNNWRNGWGNW